MTKFIIPIAEIAKAKTGAELIKLGLQYRLTNTEAVRFSQQTMDRRYKQKLKAEAYDKIRNS